MRNFIRSIALTMLGFAGMAGVFAAVAIYGSHLRRQALPAASSNAQSDARAACEKATLDWNMAQSVLQSYVNGLIKGDDTILQLRAQRDSYRRAGLLTEANDVDGRIGFAVNIQRGQMVQRDHWRQEVDSTDRIRKQVCGN